MYQVSERQVGKCLICQDTDVAELKKDGQNVKLCRKHFWESLKGATAQDSKRNCSITPRRPRSVKRGTDVVDEVTTRVTGGRRRVVGFASRRSASPEKAWGSGPLA